MLEFNLGTWAEIPLSRLWTVLRAAHAPLFTHSQQWPAAAVCKLPSLAGPAGTRHHARGGGSAYVYMYASSTRKLHLHCEVDASGVNARGLLSSRDHSFS